MNASAPLAKNRTIRLQQELVPILRATGSIEGAELYWRRMNFKKGFGRKLACYGFDRRQRQSLINQVAFPRTQFMEVDAALVAGNKLQQLYALACGDAWIAQDEGEHYKRGTKGLKIKSRKQTQAYVRK